MPQHTRPLFVYARTQVRTRAGMSACRHEGTQADQGRQGRARQSKAGEAGKAGKAEQGRARQARQARQVRAGPFCLAIQFGNMVGSMVGSRMPLRIRVLVSSQHPQGPGPTPTARSAVKNPPGQFGWDGLAADRSHVGDGLDPQPYRS